jgi:hypothetical protein
MSSWWQGSSPTLLASSDPNYALWLQSIRPESEINKADPRLQFFFHLGFAISRWAFIDRTLFDIFCRLLGSNSDEKAAYLFYKSPIISDHFHLTNNLAALSLDRKRAKAWSKIAKVFDDGVTLHFRNRLAHDPVTQIVSSIGMAGSTKHPPAIAPPSPSEWEIRIEPTKLLLRKQKPADPITRDRIIEHIDVVAALKSALDEFRDQLPKKLRKRPPKSALPKPSPKRGLAKKRGRNPTKPQRPRQP